MFLNLYKSIVKRILDTVFAAVLLVPALPIMGVCALLIRGEDSEGSVLFSQKRIGKGNKPFTMMKFRSMKIKRFDKGRELSDQERMLKIGGIIRKLSLDELPQLFNVIKGEMSFIGPRPLPVVYFPYFTEEELHRHDVRPGISGLAQVNGRNNLGWDEKFQYDLEYVRNISLGFDLKIVLETILKVLKRADVQVRKSTDKDGSLDEIRRPLRKPMVI